MDDDATFYVKKFELLAEISEMCNFAMVKPLGDAKVASMDGWRVFMQEEKNESWQLADKPRDPKLNDVKWVCRTKLDHDGSMNKLKAKLVHEGCQQHDVDFSNDFVQVASCQAASLEAEKIYKVH